MATKKTVRASAAKPGAKMGRPPIADPRQTFAMRVSAEERAAIQAAANVQGIPATSWVRMILRRQLGMAGAA